jgi:hypothetical protein
MDVAHKIFLKGEANLVRDASFAMKNKDEGFRIQG